MTLPATYTSDYARGRGEMISLRTGLTPFRATVAERT